MADGIHMEEIVWMELPALQTALAQWCALFTLTVILYGRRNWRWTDWLRAALCFTVYTTTLILCDSFFRLQRVLFLLIGLLLLFVACMIKSRGKRRLSVHLTLCVFLISEAVSSVFWQFSTYPIYFGYIQRWLPYVIMIVLYALLYVGTYYVFRRIFSEKLLKELKLKDLFFMFFLALMVYFVGNLGVFIPQSPLFNTTTWGIIQMRTMVSVIGVALLFAYHARLLDTVVEKENHAMQAVLKSQYEQYKAYEDSIEFIRIKYHDLKHQIDGLRSAKDSAHRNEWIDAMEREVELNELFMPTGHPVLDSILASKQMRARNEKIRLTCVIDGKLLNFMSAADICTIFGNGLDNAIEAVSGTEDEEQRLIHITVAEQRRFVLILLRNTCAHVPEIGENGLPRTTKAEAEHHGLGLRSIQLTVAKYGGTLTLDTVDGWFRLRILLPSPEESTDE